MKNKAQTQVKDRAARENGLSHLFNKCVCVNVISFVPTCISMYHMKQNKALIMVLNLEKSVSAITRAQLSNVHSTKTQLKVPNGGCN